MPNPLQPQHPLNLSILPNLPIPLHRRPRKRSSHHPRPPHIPRQMPHHLELRPLLLDSLDAGLRILERTATGARRLITISRVVMTIMPSMLLQLIISLKQFRISRFPVATQPGPFDLDGGFEQLFLPALFGRLVRVRDGVLDEFELFFDLLRFRHGGFRGSRVGVEGDVVGDFGQGVAVGVQGDGVGFGVVMVGDDVAELAQGVHCCVCFWTCFWR